MAIRIEVPEYNTAVEFPDETPPAEIESVLAKNYPTKAPRLFTPPEPTSTMGIASPHDQQAAKTARTFVQEDIPNVASTAGARVGAGFESAAGGLMQKLGEEPEDSIFSPDAVRDIGPLHVDHRAIAAKGRELGNESRAIQEVVNQEKPLTTRPGKILGSTVESIGANLPGMAATMVTGSPAIGLSMMGMQQFGQTYDESRAKGLSLEDATNNAAIQGGTEVATELLPFVQLSKFMKPGRLSTKVLNHYLADVPSEHIATAIENATGKYYDAPGMTDEQRKKAMYDYWTSAEHGQDQIDTFFTTILQSAVIGGMAKTAKVGSDALSTLRNTDRITAIRNRLNGMRAKPTAVAVPDTGIANPDVSVDDAIAAANEEVSGANWNHENRETLLKNLGGEQGPAPAAAGSVPRGSLDVVDPRQSLADPMRREIEGAQLTADPFTDYPVNRPIIQPGASAPSAGSIITEPGYRQKDVIPNQPILNDEQAAVQDTFLKGGPALSREGIDDVLRNQNDPNLAGEIAQGRQEAEALRKSAEAGTAQPIDLNGAGPSPVTKVDSPAQTPPAPGVSSPPAARPEPTPAAKIETPLSPVQQEFIRGKVKALGSIEAVQAKYGDQAAPVDRYAREFAAQHFATVMEATEQVPAEAPAKVPDAMPAETRQAVPEDALSETGLLRQWGDKWQYKTKAGSNWLYANSKEGAVEQASKTYSQTPESERLTAGQRFDKANAERDADLEKRYGRMTIPELEAKIEKIGGDIVSLQKAGKREFNGNGGRRTSAAVSNEGARAAGQEKMDLTRYLETRKGKEPVAPVTPSTPTPSTARAEAAAKVTAASRKIDRQNDDIAVAIAKLGGIDATEAQREWGDVVKDSRKTLANHVLAKTRRFGAVFKNGGKALDKMRESLVGHGYLSEGADLHDLYAAIEAAAGGRPGVSTENHQEDDIEREAREHEERVIAGMTDEAKAVANDILDILDEDDTVNAETVGADLSFDFGFNVEGYSLEENDETRNEAEGERATAEAAAGPTSQGDSARQAGDGEQEATDDAGGWSQGVAVAGDRQRPTIGGVQKQGGKRQSTSDLIDGFTPEPAGLFREEELRYNDSRSDKAYSISSVSPVIAGTDSSRRADGVREQLAFFTPSGEPTPEARQVVALAREVKTFTKTARVITGHVRTGLTSIRTPQDLAHVMAGLRKKTVENFVIVVTDKNDKIVGIIDQTTGTVNQSLVHPSLVLGASSLIDGAENVYLVHNHPTGDPTFSPEDRAVTDRIDSASSDTGLNLVGIMAIGSRTATFYRPMGRDEGPFAIPAAARTESIPVEGARAFTRRPAADAARITSPDMIPDAMKSAGLEGTGVMLLDGKNRVVGFVPMKDAELGKLRTGNQSTGAGLLTRTIRQTNSVAMVAISGDSDAARNLGSFGDNLGVKLLDIYNPESGYSATSRGHQTQNGANWFSLAKPQTDKKTGLPLNPDGTVTVYHHTNKVRAEQIRKTGVLRAQAEPDVYVTTRKETDTGYGDTAVPIKVDPSLLQIDDEFPNGRTDYRLSVGRSGGSLKVAVDDSPSRLSVKPFHSKLEQVVTAKMGGKMPVSDLISMLVNNGVSEAEIDNTLGGLRDEGGITTKQQVLDEIKANETELKDVILGGPAADNNLGRVKEYNDYFAKMTGKYGVYGTELQKAMTPDERTKFNNLFDQGQAAADGRPELETHFSQYTEPGAVDGSYREMFVTAPDKVQPVVLSPEIYSAAIDSIEEYGFNDGFYAVSREDGSVIFYESSKDQFDLMVSDELGDVDGTALIRVEDGEASPAESVEAGSWSDGHSQYSGIKNPIVRIRFNEREVGGKRVMFVEEMQGASDANQQKMPDYLRKRIYDIGVKRVLSYAKENGFDGVSWTTGAMQAARYDLSKQVESVKAVKPAKDSPGVWTLFIKAAGDNKTRDHYVKEQDLPNFVGKELAQKIVERNGGNFTGLDLKVGGEGLTSLYDRTLPSLFKKYGKESASTIPLKTRSMGYEEWEAQHNRMYPGQSNDEKLDAYKNYHNAQPVPFIPVTDRTPASYPKFSVARQATGADAAKIHANLTSMTAGMENAPAWQVVQSESELPATVQYEINSINASGAIRGVFTGGKIYVVADNLNYANEAESVFLHEAVAHFGLRGLLGERFNPVLQQIAMVYGKKGLQAIADRYMLDLFKPADRMTAAEEKLAEMAEIGDRVGIVKRTVALVRDWLRTHGFKVEWSDNDIKALLARARGYVELSDSQATELFDGERFSIVPDGTEAKVRKLENGDPDPSEAMLMEIGTEGKTLAEVADWLSGAVSPSEKMILDKVIENINRLAGNGVNFEFNVAHVGDRVPRALSGSRGITSYNFKPGSDKIAVWANGADVEGKVGMSKETILHELIHAATMGAVRMGNTRAAAGTQIAKDVADLYKLTNEVTRHFNQRIADSKAGKATLTPFEQDVFNGRNNALSDADEMLAWGLSDPRMQAYLESIPHQKQTMWSSFVQAIRKLLGVPATSNTAFSELLRVSEAILGDNINELLSVANITGTAMITQRASHQIVASVGRADIPAETKVQKGWRKFQDKYNRVGHLQDFLKQQGVRLSELANASRGLYTMNGKVADQLSRFMDNEIQPLVKEAAKAKINLDDISDYLLMQHAAEANAAMQKLHNDPTRTAFGVDDAEAATELAAYQARPDFATLKRLADRFQAFSTQTADMLESNGIISQEMRGAWDNAYQHYVPLRGGESDTKPAGTGKGMRVNGKQQRRSGHDRRDEHVIENIIKARESAIKTVEKNNVALSVAQLIHEAADDRIGTVGKPELRRVFKNKASYTVMFQGNPAAAFTSEDAADRWVGQDRARTGRPLSDYVLHMSSDPTVAWQASPMLGPNEINAYVNGHQVRIQINDEVAAGALTNLGAEGLGTMLSIGKQINNYLSRAYTGYDPRFTIRNTFRDFTAGMVNLTGDYGATTAAKIALNYPKAVKEFLKGRHDPTRSTWVDRYRKQGGSTGASWLSSLERLGEDVESMYQEQIGSIATYRSVYAEQIAQGRSAMAARAKALGRSGVAGFHKIPVLGHFLKMIETMNAVSENAFRVATFMTLVQAGKSEAEAGEAAKNSTINFDKRGELGAQIGALWLFFNPAMQGIQRSVFALTQSKHKHQAQAIVGSMAMVGFMAAELARGMGGDDDDEWDKIPRSVKNRNLVIRTGEKTQITIPLPYEYGSFIGIGYAMNDMVHGKADKRTALNLAGTIMDGISPLGNPISDEGEIQPLSMMPTVAKMALAPSTNTNSFGNRIAPEKFNQSKPDSQNMWRGTKGSIYDTIASGINEATGGSKYNAGAVDVSPEVLKYYTRTLLGGAATFIDQVVGLGVIGANGAQPDIAEIPMVNVLARENSVRDTRRVFWDIAKDAKTAIDGFNAAKKGHDFDTAASLKEQNATLIQVAGLAAQQAKLAKAKRDAVDAVRLDENMSFTEKREKTKELEEKEAEIYDRLIKRFNRNP